MSHHEQLKNHMSQKYLSTDFFQQNDALLLPFRRKETLQFNHNMNLNHDITVVC